VKSFTDASSRIRVHLRPLAVQPLPVKHFKSRITVSVSSVISVAHSSTSLNGDLCGLGLVACGWGVLGLFLGAQKKCAQGLRALLERKRKSGSAVL
jgi:hypothetical protein